MVLTESENKLRHGDSAPDFSLKKTDNRFYKLNEVKGKKATLVVFMCNHCPYVIAKLQELNRIYESFTDKGLEVIGINSNESDNYPEDSFSAMQDLVQKGVIKFSYFHDESQETAKAYGAVCTPDPFLFDGNLKLIFHSRIDNPSGVEPAADHELYNTIQDFLETSKISTQETPSMGCNIKWK